MKIMVKKANFWYVFKNESVTLVISHSPPLGNQYLSFNCYSLQSRKRFYKFSKILQESEPNEYDNINDIYGLAQRFEVRATNGHKPTFIETIAF